MFKALPCLPENVPFWAFRGPLALHLRLLAIVIIPNLVGIFNNNQTFLQKKYSMLDSGCSLVRSGEELS
jgi:hypothetical protein